jgi:F-type H+-transporting ATPase subunit a
MVSGVVRKVLATLPPLAMASFFLLFSLADPGLAQESHEGAEAAHEEGHEDHGSRAGDSSLFMELFGHLEPHAIFGVWMGGDEGFHVFTPHDLDNSDEPFELNPETGKLEVDPNDLQWDSHGNPLLHKSSQSLNEEWDEMKGGGMGFLIYNINTVMWIAGVLLMLIFIPVASKARRRSGEPPRGAAYGLLESLVQFVRDDMVYAVMGEGAGRRFVPLFLTQFFFVLFMNMMALVPMGHVGGTATGNLAVTGGLALTTLIWIHLSGIREHGFVSHWKNFVPQGLPWFVLPIIVPVEILGMLVKPAALTIRLFANLTAGHLIVLGLFGLVFFFDSIPIALPIMGMSIAIYCLELFVCFVQAYIFTYLSIVFLGASVHPDH